jgi:signal peptidase I
MQSENLQKSKSNSKEFWKFLAIVVFIILPIRLWVIEPFIVSGDSMYPTFENHDYLIVDSLTYRIEDPKRFDVLIFKYPLDTKRYFIKRVIGLPGETVTIKNEKITITNSDDKVGFVIDKPDLDVKTQGDIEMTLKNDEFFVLGDNRPVSSDSRIWGSLKKEFIVGRPLLRLFPFGQIDILPGEVAND